MSIIIENNGKMIIDTYPHTCGDIPDLNKNSQLIIQNNGSIHVSGIFKISNHVINNAIHSQKNLHSIPLPCIHSSNPQVHYRECFRPFRIEDVKCNGTKAPSASLEGADSNLHRYKKKSKKKIIKNFVRDVFLLWRTSRF